MTAGTTPPIYLEQHPPAIPVRHNDTYLLIRIHSVRAYVETPWLTRTSHLVCSTDVSSSFLPGQTNTSIHRVEAMTRNTPCLLGLRVNLTDWLPAIPEKTISVTIKLAAIMDAPFGRLTEKIAQLGLTSTFSLMSGQIQTGVKVAEIAGKVLSSVLEEGNERQLLTLRADFNINDLQAGYYAVVAPQKASDVPRALRLTRDGRLEDPKVPFSEQHTYAVLEVCVLERRGEDAARAEAWWQVLQDGRRVVASTLFNGERERRKLNAAWQETLARAERMAQDERGFLLSEIRAILQANALAVRQILNPPTVLEATTDDALSDEEQQVLGVATVDELAQAVTAYHEALARSQAIQDDSSEQDHQSTPPV